MDLAQRREKRRIVVFFPIERHDAMIRIGHVQMPQMAFHLQDDCGVFLFYREVIVVDHQLNIGIVHRFHPSQSFGRVVDDVALLTPLRLDCDS